MAFQDKRCNTNYKNMRLFKRAPVFRHSLFSFIKNSLILWFFQVENGLARFLQHYFNENHSFQGGALDEIGFIQTETALERN